MGYAIAKTAALRGADVTLVSGPAEVEPPMFVNFVPVVTAKDMFEAVTGRSDEMDAVIKAAAVADYRPKFVNTEKTKKKDGDMAIELERTDDIFKVAWWSTKGQPVSLRIFHGDGTYAGEFQGKIKEEEPSI